MFQKLISTLHKLNQITCTVIENNPEKKMSKNRVSISSRYSCNSELYASKKRHQINTKIPIRNPINEHKGMPIIVKTQSLSKNLVNTPNSIKIEKVTSEPKVVKTVPLPFVTVIKKGKNVSSKSVFDIVKYGPIINIDDDEDVEKGESLQPLSISMEVMDIESGDNTKDEKSPERKGQEQVHCKEITRNGFEASLSIDESSEKENFESVIKKSYNNNDIDEPLQKKTKFIDLKSLHSEVECCKITKKLNDSPISSNTNRQINTNIDDKVEKKDSEADIHPVFQQFLNLYLTFDKYNDKKKNVADKLTKYYKAIDKNYAKSEEFCSFIKKKMFEMKQYPKQSMLYVREIADDLKAHRLISNSIKAASSKSAGISIYVKFINI